MKDKSKKKILRNFLINFFDIDKNFKGEIKYETIDKWDSISHLDLIFELEKKFKKKLRKYYELTSESRILKVI
jgi:acyl carrier protein